MNKLYLLHDEDYSYKVVVSAQNANEALEKLDAFFKDTKQVGELWRDLHGLPIYAKMIELLSRFFNKTDISWEV